MAHVHTWIGETVSINCVTISSSLTSTDMSSCSCRRPHGRLQGSSQGHHTSASICDVQWRRVLRLCTSAIPRPDLA